MSKKRTVILQRDEVRGVLYPGTEAEVSLQLPPTQSMLGLISRNPVRDGDAFGEDGMVRNPKAQPRKWFSPMQGWNHFWEPVLNDPAHLEAVYHKLVLRQQARGKQLWAHVQHIIDTTKSGKNKYGDKSWSVHCQPTRPENQAEGKCWLYDIHHVHHNNQEQPSFSMEWVDIPSKFKHLALGNELYRLERLTQGPMRWRMASALDAAFLKLLKSKYPDWQKMPDDTLLEIRVNGRHYLYRVGYNRYGAMWMEKQMWAEDNYHVVQL